MVCLDFHLNNKSHGKKSNIKVIGNKKIRNFCIYTFFTQPQNLRGKFKKHTFVFAFFIFYKNIFISSRNLLRTCLFMSQVQCNLFDIEKLRLIPFLSISIHFSQLYSISLHFIQFHFNPFQSKYSNHQSMPILFVHQHLLSG